MEDISITLYEEDKQTKVEWVNIFPSVPSLEEAVRAFKTDEGLKQSLERLSQYLKNHDYE